MAILDHTSPEERAEEEKYWKLYIGNDHNKYIPIWRSFRDGGSKISFNFGALILSFFWLLTRKMYLFAGLLVLSFFVSIIVIGLIEQALYPILGYYLFVQTDNPIGTIAFSIPYIPFLSIGFIGNWLYYINGTKQIAKKRQEFSSEEKYKDKLVQTGGISKIGKLITIVTITIIVGSLIIALLTLGSNWR